MLRKYGTQAFEEEWCATKSDTRTLTPWTNIWPTTCFETSNILHGDVQNGREKSHQDRRRTISSTVVWAPLAVFYKPMRGLQELPSKPVRPARGHRFQVELMIRSTYKGSGTQKL